MKYTDTHQEYRSHVLERESLHLLTKDKSNKPNVMKRLISQTMTSSTRCTRQTNSTKRWLPAIYYLSSSRIVRCFEQQLVSVTVFELPFALNYDRYVSVSFWHLQ